MASRSHVRLHLHATQYDCLIAHQMSTHHVHNLPSCREWHECEGGLAGPAGRLTGTLLGVKSIPSLPLSAEGQAHRLIGEATDKENLGSMYIWCADCHTLNLPKALLVF